MALAHKSLQGFILIPSGRHTKFRNLDVDSDAGVILEEPDIGFPQILGIAEPPVPSCAALLHRCESCRSHLLLQSFLLLQYLHCETRRCMPSNMAVDEPRARIVCFESDCNKAIRWEEYNIPTRRIVVLELEIRRSRQIESLIGLLQDGKVVPVQVDLRNHQSTALIDKTISAKLTGCAAGTVRLALGGTPVAFPSIRR